MEKLESVGDYYLVNSPKRFPHLPTYFMPELFYKIYSEKLDRISNEIIESSYKESVDVFDLLDEAESKLYDVSREHQKSSDTAQNLVMLAKKIEEIANKDGLGVATGFQKLDLLTSMAAQ